MPEAFLSLSQGDQREALEVAASKSGRPAFLFEKDVRVVWVLACLFESPFADHLVFKGGTSLSKVYGAIRRFSEDIDVTYDIRALAPHLVGAGEDPIPPTRSQAKKWADEIRPRLRSWIADEVLPFMRDRLAQIPASAQVRAEEDRLYVSHTPLTGGSRYVSPDVMIEFGARSTGEPCETRRVVCDAAEHLTALVFPEASPRVMRIERTFWEKATAAHVFCLQGHFAAARFSRHWHDIVRLDDTGYLTRALEDGDLALDVARHKSKFFAERDSAGQWIDYDAAVSGSLRLVPDKARRDTLADDYARMVEANLLPDDAEDFDALMERCRDIEARINASRSPSK